MYHFYNLQIPDEKQIKAKNNNNKTQTAKSITKPEVVSNRENGETYSKTKTGVAQS